MAKAIKKKDDTAMVSTERPEWMEDDSMRGQEGVGVDDLTIPRLGVIQDLSPQRKKTAPEYIEGADSGMLFNTVTGRLYGTEVMFVPVYYRKEWVIWKSVNAGGGFNGAFPTEAGARAEFSEKEMEGQLDDKGNDLYEINDTGQQFGLVLNDDGSVEDIVMSMSKSKRKVDRQFNTMIKMAGRDRFSRVYKISAVEDQNAAGQDYFNFGVAPLGFVNEDTFLYAEKMYEAISSGAKDVNRDSESAAAADSAEY